MEDADAHVTEEARTPPIIISPFTLKEKLVALDDTQARGLKRLRSEFQSHEDKLLKMVYNEFDDADAKSEKISAVKKQTAGLADKAVKLHEASRANQRQRLIQSAHVDELRCAMSRMVAECETVCLEVDTLPVQRAKQSEVNFEIAQIQRQFEVTLTEHKKQVQGPWSRLLKEPSDVDTDFDVKTRSRLTRRVSIAQSELLKSQIADAVLVERLKVEPLLSGFFPLATGS